MKVLSMFYKHKEGGFSKRLYRMYMALAREGHDVHYIACEPFPISDSRIHFHRISVPFTRQENVFFWALFLLFAPIYALWICWKIRADRIAVFGSWYAAFMFLPRLLLRRKIIVFLRADSVVLYKIENRSFFAKITNYIFQYLGLIISNNIWVNIGVVKTSIVKRYGLAPQKIQVIHNNIDSIYTFSEETRYRIRRDIGINNDYFVVSTSGIFYRRKNISFLIRAFAQANLENKALLLIIGDDVSQGTERNRLDNLTKELNISNSVIFTGWRTDSSKIIGASDLYVLPTLHEGFPNSLLDALSVGCPVLGSRIDEIREVLQYDELLFGLKNTNELTAKLKKTVADSTYLALLRKLSVKRARKFNFDWDKFIIKAATK